MPFVLDENQKGYQVQSEPVFVSFEMLEDEAEDLAASGCPDIESLVNAIDNILLDEYNFSVPENTLKEMCRDFLENRRE